MGFENFKNEALTANVNTLIELFQSKERQGELSPDSESAVNAIERTIQKHTTSVEGGHNKISDPEAFLDDLHAARDRALEAAHDDDEKAMITETFGHVDIQ